MNAKWVVLSLLCLVIWTAERSNAAPLVSAALSERIPDAAEKLKSPDIRERLKVLDELIVPIGGDVVGFKLRYDLPTKDYLYVLNSILVGDLRGLDNETLWIGLAKACHVIRTLKLKEMAKPITGYLQNSNPGIQYEILETLKAITATESIPDVVPLLKSSEEWIRRESLDTLVELHAKESVPYLVEGLQDKDPLKRYSALMGLIKVNGREAASSIAKLIEDPDRNNRYWVLDALVKLGAREYAPNIWRLLDGQESAQTEAYAIAALITFGQRRAIPMAIERATVKDLALRSQMLDFLVQVRAKAVGPSLVAVLEMNDVMGGDIGTDSNIRRDIMVCLGRLEVAESIPVLKQYVKNPKNYFLRRSAVSTLGILKAREAVEDLLPLLNEKANGDIHVSAEAAVALAKIGDKKTWPQLIQFTENPSHPCRSEIISQLNAFLDPELWQAIHTRKVQGLYIKPVNTTVEAFSRQSGIRIVLHFQPQKELDDTSSPQTDYPQTNTSVMEINLIHGIQQIMEAFGERNNPVTKNPYTFVFDDNEIHIMPVAEAVNWWKENIIFSLSKSQLKQ